MISKLGAFCMGLNLLAAMFNGAIAVLVQSPLNAVFAVFSLAVFSWLLVIERG